MIKYDKTKSGSQRYICKLSNKTRVENYIYKAYQPNINTDIIVLTTKEGVGIRSTARVLQISTTTLLKRIISIAKNINQPIIIKGKVYEVDEMCIYKVQMEITYAAVQKKYDLDSTDLIA